MSLSQARASYDLIVQLRQKLLSSSVLLTMAVPGSLTQAMANSPVLMPPSMSAHQAMHSFGQTPLIHSTLSHVSQNANHSQNAIPHGFSFVSAAAAMQTNLSTFNLRQSQGGEIAFVTPGFVKSVTTNGNLQKIDLDLDSTHAITSGSGINGLTSVTLNVGGVRQTFNSASLMTPAEVAAVYQVIETGHQSLLLDRAGSADGGSLRLTQALNQNISGLDIPKGVTVVDNVVSSDSNIVLNQGLSNAGKLIFTGDNSSSASQLVTAPSIVNSGSIIGQHTDLTFVTSQVNNLGQIKTDGNLTFNTSANGNLTVNGGYLSGQSVNFNAPSANLLVAVSQISGPVNVTAGSASVASQVGTLTINQSNVGGDPYYVSGGNLNLDSSTFTTGGAIFVAYAGGDITTSTGTLAINTVSSTVGVAGGDIDIEAGVTYADNGSGTYRVTGASATGGSIILPNVSLLTNGGNVTLVANHGSGTSSGGITIGDITTSGDISHIDGGNVTIVGNNTTTIGNVGAAGLGVPLSTTQGGGGGNVTIIVNTNSLLTVGNIDTHGGAGGSLPVGVSGDGGDGGDGGNGYKDAVGTAKAGGPGGSGGGSAQLENEANPGAGGLGGASDSAGMAGTQGAPPAGKGGDGGTGGTTLAYTGGGSPGYDGKAGFEGAMGGTGGDGQSGGDGGAVRVSTGGNLVIGTVTTYGGQGGNGLSGGNGGGGGGGGSGGRGEGGRSGPLVNNGAAPGVAGVAGGAGGNGVDGSDAGDGGDGGTGGDGGAGGAITLTAGGSIAITRNNNASNSGLYALDASGGQSGPGGNGGNGGVGGHGGAGGDGGNGGNGGVGGSSATPSGTDGNGKTTYSIVPYAPGDGGAGGAGGTGGVGGSGGSGGDGGDAGKGGEGGNITLNAGSTVTEMAFGNKEGIIASVIGGSSSQAGIGGRYGQGGGGGMGGKSAAGGSGQSGDSYTRNNPMGSSISNNPTAPAASNNGAAGATGSGGMGGDGGDAGDGGNGGAAGFSGVFTVQHGALKIDSVSGTTTGENNYVVYYARVAGASVGGAPGFLSTMGYGSGGQSGDQKVTAAKGAEGNPGNIGADGAITFATVIKFAPLNPPVARRVVITTAAPPSIVHAAGAPAPTITNKAPWILPAHIVSGETPDLKSVEFFRETSLENNSSTIHVLENTAPLQSLQTLSAPAAQQQASLLTVPQ